jgi:hypothetical protein
LPVHALVPTLAIVKLKIGADTSPRFSDRRHDMLSNKLTDLLYPAID